MMTSTPAVLNAVASGEGAQALGFAWVLLLAVVCLVLFAAPAVRTRRPHVWWAVWGFPAAALRVVFTWRRVTTLLDLAVARRPAFGLLGDLMVKGKPLKPSPPRIGLPRLRRGGLEVRVRLHPGQVPGQFAAAVDALAHAWRVHTVRARSDQRGTVCLMVSAWDPLADPTTPPLSSDRRLLAAAVGWREDGAAWVVDLRRVPHWLIVGATRSGKSTLLATLVRAWARQPVALVGIDLKGGLELAQYEPRLTALACDRAQAAGLLARLVEITGERMGLCREHGARSVWDLPARLRPVPVVVLVDEVAELYLMADRSERDEVAAVTTALLRLGQLGAALGVHLVVAGQRVGSDLGLGVTALRAQLGGRVCHRVHDPGTAEMVLGDLDRDALSAAQQITPEQPGVAVAFGDDGRWTRVRSVLTTPEQARRTAAKYARLTPDLSQLGSFNDTGNDEAGKEVCSA